MQEIGRLESGNRYRQIAEIARLVHESDDLQEIFCRLTEGVCRHSEWDMSSIQVLDTRTQRTMPIVRFDPQSDQRVGTFEDWDATDSPLTRIIESGTSLVLRDAAEQDEFRGFRQDARRRGYHTVVMVPLEFPDEIGRPMVFTVLARSVVAVDEAELSFLECLADLSGIAVRRMQLLKRERAEAGRLQGIVRNLTSALATTLDAEAAKDLYTELSRLFPTGWFGIDLTTGRGLCDAATASHFVRSMVEQMPREVVEIALRAPATAEGQTVTLRAGAERAQALVRGLTIDGSRVGALFLLDAENLSEHETIAAEAGRLALSTLILRDYMVFKSGRITARRLISRLAEGDWRQDAEVLKEARMLGLDLARPSRLLVIRHGGAAPEDGPQSFVLKTAQALFGPAVSTVLDNAIVVLMQDGEPLGTERARAEFLRRIRSVLPGTVTLALSEPLPEIGLIAGALEGCRRKLQVAAAMSASGWVSEQEIGAFPVLMSSLDAAATRRFLASTIEPIADGGSAKGRVALETLSTFLETGRRLQDTARLLGIHVSTLRYRLDRLAEAHDLDLMDSEACFELELALRLHKLRTSYRS
jgi:hypothetical protein